MSATNQSESKLKSTTNIQTWILTILRIAIGWHLLYEGLVKLFIPEWSAAAYLDISRWIFAPIFQWIASTPAVLAVVNFLNIWGLILIGLGLMFGVLTRLAGVAGIVLIGLYYLANPPFVGLDFGVPSEGNYLMVDKNLLEILALAVIVIFPAAGKIGLGTLVKRRAIRSADQPKKAGDAGHPTVTVPDVSRRDIVKSLATLPFAGAFAVALAQKRKWESYEEKNLVDAFSSASAQAFEFAALDELQGQIPTAKIKNAEVSRLILGGNLMNGWAHSRDLIYVSDLVKAYFHRDKIFETMLLAEKCGINTLLTHPQIALIVNEYWKRGIGRMQFISDSVALNYTAEGITEKPMQEYHDDIHRAIDRGAIACYVQGETADYYIENNGLDKIHKTLEFIRSKGVIAGIGAHRIETIRACVEGGLEPDFWMKTLHHHNYWSAKHEEWHDNMYCFKPEETIEFMKTVGQPWIAFKTMAAGSIRPADAFRYAYENGADFVCAGMYDFQMVEDANIALNALNGDLQRSRPWMA